MLFSLSVIILAGLLSAAISEKIGLPRIIGLLCTGLAVSPYALDLLDSSVLDISQQLRQIALIIILIKAGLSLNLADLKKVGRPAVMMSFLPATFEIIGYVLFAPLLLGIDHIEAAVMGAVLRTCPHRVNVRIIRHNFVGDKAKIRRRAVALQGFLRQYRTKLVLKMRCQIFRQIV